MITSPDNEKVKTLRKLLGQKKHRYQMRQYVVECVTADRIAEMKNVSHVYTSDESYGSDTLPVTQVSADILRKLATTESAPPYLVVLDMAIQQTLPAPGRFVYADSIQDPGNLGTIVRTAAAFGYDGVAFGSGTVDPYSPKTVRSSAGCVTEIPLYRVEPDALGEHCVIVSDIKGTPLDDFTPPRDFVIVFGNEAAGASREMMDRADARVAIPTRVDSLNVAVAAGVLLHALSRDVKRK
jgi:TrmH family RNA methyltransferase